MKWKLLVISVYLGLGTAYSQAKKRTAADTIVFINFNESSLVAQKKMRLLEARQQNRISDSWDLKQFYLIDAKRVRHDTEKLKKELKKGKINFKFVSVSSDSGTANPIGDNCSMITDFKVEESRNGKLLMIYETSALLDRDGTKLMEGDAAGIIKKLKHQK